MGEGEELTANGCASVCHGHLQQGESVCLPRPIAQATARVMDIQGAHVQQIFLRHQSADLGGHSKMHQVVVSGMSVLRVRVR